MGVWDQERKDEKATSEQREDVQPEGLGHPFLNHITALPKLQRCVAITIAIIIQCPLRPLPDA